MCSTYTLGDMNSAISPGESTMPDGSKTLPFVTDTLFGFSGVMGLSSRALFRNISRMLDMKPPKMESLIMQLQKDIIFWALSVLKPGVDQQPLLNYHTRQAIWAYIGT